MLARINRVSEGDQGPRLRFTLLKPNRTPWNLAGAAVSLVMAGGNTYNRKERDCEIQDAAAGKVYYDLVSADTQDMAGKYKLRAIIDYGTDIYTTVNWGELEVVEAP